MNARQYAVSQFLAPENVKKSPVWTVVGCEEVEVKFKNQEPTKRLRLLLDNGSEEKYFTLNKTNVGNMIKAWGEETDYWIGKPIELGTITALISGEKKELIEVKGRALTNKNQPNPSQQNSESEPSGSDSSSNINARSYAPESFQHNYDEIKVKDEIDQVIDDSVKEFKHNYYSKPAYTPSPVHYREILKNHKLEKFGDKQ